MMIIHDPIHMPANPDIGSNRGLPLSEFLSQVFIFVGFFISLHAFLDLIKAKDGISIVIGILIVGIGCAIYAIDQHYSKKS